MDLLGGQRLEYLSEASFDSWSALVRFLIKLKCLKSAGFRPMEMDG